MQKSDLAKEIENQVLKDIEYIKNFISIAPNAQIAPDYTDAAMVKSVTTSIYPQLYAYLVQSYSKEEAIRRLKVLGRRSIPIFFSINPKNLTKKRGLKTIFKEISRHSGEITRLKDVVKKNNVIQSCTITKYKCIFCTEAPPVENTEIPYCYPSLAFYQNYYNIRSLYLGKIKPRLIHLEMIKTAEHDKDYCAYHMEAID